MCEACGPVGIPRRAVFGLTAGVATLLATSLGMDEAVAAPDPDVSVRPDLTIRPRSAWAEGRLPAGTLEPEDVRFLLVHHSATPSQYTAEKVPAMIRGIYNLHTGPAKGWPDVAYNFFIDRYGTVWEGRAGSIAGPVKCDATAGSQGFAQLVCLIGDFTNEMPTDSAIDALARTLAWLADRHGLDTSPGATTRFISRGSNRYPAGVAVTATTISAHRDVTYTACPGDTFAPFVQSQLQAAVHARRPAARPTKIVVRGYGSAVGPSEPEGSSSWFERPSSSASMPVALAGLRTGRGGYLAFADGDVVAFGSATALGSMAGQRLNRPIVGIATTADENGYWLVADDGGIFSFGSARFHGSTGSIILNRPIVGIGSTPSSLGYWLCASDGGIFAFGDAAFLGSMGSTRLNAPVIGLVSAPGGRGYQMVASDGGVFTFGGARFFGSAANSGARWIGLGAASDGYVLLGAHGEIAAFGSVAVSLPASVAGAVAVALTPSGDGALVAAVEPM
ncbi:MAG: N-acetylmuramoyl-L-alanine amidase [Acidimicrobiia bacterium]